MTRSNVAAAVMAAAAFLLALSSAVADESVLNTTWATGLEYSSGSYGGDADIEDLYLPVGVSLNFRRVSLDLTVPYLSVSAPEGTTDTGPDGQPIPGSGQMVTESGLGDVIAGITIYDVMYSHDLGLALDLTGRIKLGTADVDKGLGTGEQDFTIRADLYKYFEHAALLGSIGYKIRGEPEGVDLEDVLLGSIGSIFYPSEKSSVGLILDYRESAIPDGDAVSELSAFVARKFSDSWSVQFYVFTGFTDSSSDWGGGFLLIAS